MNREEAQFILRAYRANGEDARDPQFQEALALVRQDPELARWFAGELALDSRISAKLNKAITPPAQLKAQLLAQQKIIRPVVWWRQPAMRLALAACLALLVTVAVWFNSTRVGSFARYRDAMADFTGNKLDRLDLMSRDVAEVRRWLAQKDSHADLVLPAGLDGRPSIGCRVLDWQGHKVTLICFTLENRHEAHLLVVDRTLFKDAPTESPAFNQSGDVATVSWSRGSKAYVMVSKGGSQLDLMKLL
jgi:hypothetical protein